MYALRLFGELTHIVFSLRTLAQISLVIVGIVVCSIIAKKKPSLLRILGLVYLLILCGSMDIFSSFKIPYRDLYAQTEREGWHVFITHPISAPVVLIMCLACWISLYATKKVSDELWVELGMPEKLRNFMKKTNKK